MHREPCFGLPYYKEKGMIEFDLYRTWLTSEKLSREDRAELEAFETDTQEIRERFCGRLTFGTGGLRGTMKIGLHHMNVYTVAHATQGLANHILAGGYAGHPTVIAYDSRNNSELFARTVACVFAANDIPVYLFDGIRPTPELSFAVRELGCIAGVNITASHNPKEYNGYKVYWQDGAQLSPEDAAAVSREIDRLDPLNDVKHIPYENALADGKIRLIGSEIDEIYLERVLEQTVLPEAVTQVSDNLKIVYSPIHGAGYRMVPEILRRRGLKYLYPVPEQAEPDGNFPTVEKPNPEYFSTFERGIRLANEVGSDIVLATDPDADRIGVVARTKQGKFVPITGNQMGALLLDYMINAYQSKGNMPPDAYVVKTIVTSEMVTSICQAHALKLYHVLTGFKYIGEVIKRQETLGHGYFLFGLEESYGYLKGTYTRDKDAVLASMLICEMTAFYYAKGMTLIDALDSLWEKYGFTAEMTDEIYFAGTEGVKKIQKIMEKLRLDLPAKIAGIPVSAVGDYLDRNFTDLTTGEKTKIDLPVSDVLYFRLNNQDVIVIRPSGTEPKIKFYYLISSATKETASETIEKYRKCVNGWF